MNGPQYLLNNRNLIPIRFGAQVPSQCMEPSNSMLRPPFPPNYYDYCDQPPVKKDFYVAQPQYHNYTTDSYGYSAKWDEKHICDNNCVHPPQPASFYMGSVDNDTSRMGQQTVYNGPINSTAAAGQVFIPTAPYNVGSLPPTSNNINNSASFSQWDNTSMAPPASNKQPLISAPPPMNTIMQRPNDGVDFHKDSMEERVNVMDSSKSWQLCELCNTRFTSEQEYNRHCRGVMHSQRILAKEMRVGILPSPANADDPSSSNVNNSNNVSVPNRKRKLLGEIPSSVKNCIREISIKNSTPDSSGTRRITTSYGVGFYCELCDVECNTAQMLKLHTNGKRHQKLLKMRVQLVKMKPSAKGQRVEAVDTGRNAEIQVTLDNYAVPIIGATMVDEFISEAGLHPTRYICNLCQAKCDKQTILPHLTGFKHRITYFKEVRSELYASMNAYRDDRDQMGYLCDEYSALIKQQEGCGKVRQRKEVFVEDIDDPAESMQEPLTSKPAFDSKARKPQFLASSNKNSHSATNTVGNKQNNSGSNNRCVLERNIRRSPTQSYDEKYIKPFLNKQPQISSDQQTNTCTSNELLSSKSPENAVEELDSCTIGDLICNLASGSVKSDEDATLLQQVANALTQSLLQYRLQKVLKSTDDTTAKRTPSIFQNKAPFSDIPQPTTHNIPPKFAKDARRNTSQQPPPEQSSSSQKYFSKDKFPHEDNSRFTEAAQHLRQGQPFFASQTPQHQQYTLMHQISQLAGDRGGNNNRANQLVTTMMLMMTSTLGGGGSHPNTNSNRSPIDDSMVSSGSTIPDSSQPFVQNFEGNPFSKWADNSKSSRKGSNVPFNESDYVDYYGLPRSQFDCDGVSLFERQLQNSLGLMSNDEYSSLCSAASLRNRASSGSKAATTADLQELLTEMQQQQQPEHRQSSTIRIDDLLDAPQPAATTSSTDASAEARRRVLLQALIKHQLSKFGN